MCDIAAEIVMKHAFSAYNALFLVGNARIMPYNGISGRDTDKQRLTPVAGVNCIKTQCAND